MTDKGAPVRLQRYLAACGVASRRKSEELILAGRVQVNGTIARVLGTKVSLTDSVKFDGKLIKPETRELYIALNKPRGYICSSSDPENRPMAIELLASRYSERIYNVGRLDFNTSGLLLFTNDGDFSKIVSHPSSEIEKEYLVETADPIEEAVLSNFKKGITIDRIRFKISDYHISGPRQIRIILIEGKNREIRRLFATSGHYLRRIHRVRIGPARIGNLGSGEHRFLTEREINWFLRQDKKKKKLA